MSSSCTRGWSEEICDVKKAVLLGAASPVHNPGLLQPILFSTRSLPSSEWYGEHQGDRGGRLLQGQAWDEQNDNGWLMMSHSYWFSFTLHMYELLFATQDVEIDVHQTPQNPCALSVCCQTKMPLPVSLQNSVHLCTLCFIFLASYL